MDTHDIVLTGIPRSGTTLACHLLNKLPDTVALHEPIEWAELTDTQDHETVCDEIRDVFSTTRESLCKSGRAISQQIDGQVPDNPMSGRSAFLRWIPNRVSGLRALGGIRLRRIRASRAAITVDKTLSNQFVLCIKHTGPFTALLGNLRTRYRCYAIVRNPLAVLASWNSIRFALREGHMFEAERLDRTLSQNLSQISDRFARQFHLLSWFFEQYERLLPREDVIFYETVVASRGRALHIVNQRANSLDEPLSDKNNNSLYNRRLMQFLGEKLLKTEGAVWDFYSKTSVEELLVA